MASTPRLVDKTPAARTTLPMSLSVESPLRTSTWSGLPASTQIGARPPLEVACEGSSPLHPVSTAPTPVVAAAPTTRVTGSGTVWLHGTAGVTRYTNGRMFGWVQLPTRGSTTGPVPTDADGRFQLPSLPSGTYTLVAWYEGETRVTRSVAVPATGWAEVDLVIP